MKYLSLFLAVLVASNVHAANVATSDVTNQAQLKKWHMLFDVNHQAAVRDDQFASTDLTLFFDYALNPKNSFRILQAPTKTYDLGGTRGENEWIPSDTIVSHFWNTPWQIESTGTRFRLVSVINLPTSIESQDNDKILTFGNTLQMNSMIKGAFLVSLRPFYRYNWNKYKTSGFGDTGGRPLPVLTYGVTMLNSYNITDKISLNGTFSWAVIQESPSQYDTSTNMNGMFGENPGGTYSVSLAANFSFTDKVAAYVGFYQGATYLQDGRFEVYAYDPRVSRFQAGLTLYW